MRGKRTVKIKRIRQSLIPAFVSPYTLLTPDTWIKNA
jgi:hypothetical protein